MLYSSFEVDASLICKILSISPISKPVKLISELNLRKSSNSNAKTSKSHSPVSCNLLSVTRSWRSSIFREMVYSYARLSSQPKLPCHFHQFIAVDYLEGFINQCRCDNSIFFDGTSYSFSLIFIYFSSMSVVKYIDKTGICPRYDHHRQADFLYRSITGFRPIKFSCYRRSFKQSC